MALAILLKMDSLYYSIKLCMYVFIQSDQDFKPNICWNLSERYITIIINYGVPRQCARSSPGLFL
jgi:hypothetical protein